MISDLFNWYIYYYPATLMCSGVARPYITTALFTVAWLVILSQLCILVFLCLTDIFVVTVEMTNSLERNAD